MDNTTYYQRNGEIMLNRAKDYYENDKERLREQARNKCRNLSKENKNKKREYAENRYRNISEEKKPELKEHQKRRYREAKGSKNNESNSVFTIKSIYLKKTNGDKSLIMYD